MKQVIQVLALVARIVRRRRSERGAVLVMTVPVLILAMVASALSVDIGRQVVEKRADQSVADMAALDAARAVGQYPPSTATVVLASAAQAAAVASAARNHFGGAAGETVQAALGSIDAATNSFVTTGASAVRVTVASLIDYAFLPGAKSLTARAIAKVGSPDAAFSVGSTLASIDTKRSRLDPMLRTWLGSGSLALVSYDGLATGDVKLRTLRTRLLAMGIDVGTTEKLLTTNMTLAQLFTASAQALGDDSEPTAQAELNDLLNATITNTTQIQLGRFLNIAQPTSDAALDTTVNAWHLVNASAQAANGSSFVDVPLAGITVPGLTGVTAKLKMIEPAQYAVGPVGTTAHTSQVTLRVTVNVPLGFLLPTAAVTLDYTSANANALLSAINCGVASPGLVIDAGTSAVAVSGNAVVPAGTMTLWSTIAPTPTTPVNFNHPTEFAPSSKHVGASTLGLNASTLNVTGGASVAALVPVLQGLMPNVLTTLNTSLSPALQPLFANLGVNVAGADLTAFSIAPAPTTCGGRPRLAQ